MEHTKHCKITPEIRDAMVRLNNAGIKASEVANILNVSMSSVAYTLQCYKAAESDDWDTLRRLTGNQSTNVKWALDKFGKTLPEATVPAPDSEIIQVAPIVKDDTSSKHYEEIQKSLNGIGFLLSEILAELRG